MAKKYTADTFEGDVTGSASENVLKAGDTMTGNLNITKTSARLQLDGSANGVINIRNGTGAYDAEGKITFGDDSVANSTTALIQCQDNPGAQELMLQYGTTVSSYYNQIKIRSTNTYFTDPIRLGLDSTSGELTYTKTNRTGSVGNSYYLDGASYGTAEHYQYYTLVGSICTLVGYVSLSTYSGAASVSRMVLPYTAAYRTGAFARQGGHITNWSSSGCTFANTMINPTCWVEDNTNLLYIQTNGGTTGTTAGRTAGSFAAGCFSSGTATITLEYSITYRIA
jgi:hypothetical protein